ncbi:MAG TPA: hypothetical protein EYP59_08010 [Thiotrichaceae bacterium]|nr:hypothetical protein [Thiotrichaceae bacterium]
MPFLMCNVLALILQSDKLNKGKLAQLNLPNVTLQHKDILAIDADWGYFDKAALLEILRDLTARGIIVAN